MKHSLYIPADGYLFLTELLDVTVQTLLSHLEAAVEDHSIEFVMGHIPGFICCISFPDIYSPDVAGDHQLVELHGRSLLVVDLWLTASQCVPQVAADYFLRDL